MTTDLPHDPLGRLIYFTAQEIHNLAKKILQPLDITLEQFHILKFLVKNDGLTQCQLCRAANKSAANMTRLLDRLASKSLLTRKTNPHDRRAAMVMLTAKGRSLVVEARKVLDSFAVSMNQGLSITDEQVVRAALQTIGANLRTMAEAWHQPRPQTNYPSSEGDQGTLTTALED